MRPLAAAALLLVLLSACGGSTSASPAGGPAQPDCTKSNWRERFNAALDGTALPYEPHRGEAVLAAFTRAGFVLEPENEIFAVLERGAAWQDLCKLRWFTETRFHEGRGERDGYLKVWVLGTSADTAEWVSYRTDVARKYDYAGSWIVLHEGNVVVEYFFRQPDGRPVKRDRRADVHRVLRSLSG